MSRNVDIPRPVLTSDVISSSEVARRLGIKTQTLAKWRMEGKGPKGWFHFSATRVSYPADAVEAFLREKREKPAQVSVIRRLGRRPKMKIIVGQPE